MSTEERTDFSKFGIKFQERLVRLILDDRSFADQMSEVLEVDFLETKYLRIFVKKIFEYRERYKTHPSRDSMVTVIRADLANEQEVVQKQIRDFFARAMAREEEIDGDKHIKEVSLDFCKKQVLKKTMMECVDLIKTSRYDEIAGKINDSLKLGADTNFGYDYMVDFEQRFNIKARDAVTTGWIRMDKLMRGGLGRGELGVVIAPTSVGKSMALVHLGAEALKQGMTVVHYTLELLDTVVAIRYDSCLTGTSLSDVFINKENIFEDLQDIEGKLIVKEYPTKTATTMTITQHLERLARRGIIPDLVIVDYGDLLRPLTPHREKRVELESIYEQLRALAQQFKCAVWTASQTNRGGLNAEVITMESISEAFNKCFIADFIFSISRTAEDKNNNEGRVFIAKNRNGPDGLVFPIFMDTAFVKIDVLASTGETVSDVIANTAKQQEQLLKEKYKKFREEKKKNVKS